MLESHQKQVNTTPPINKPGIENYSGGQTPKTPDNPTIPSLGTSDTNSEVPNENTINLTYRQLELMLEKASENGANKAINLFTDARSTLLNEPYRFTSKQTAIKLGVSLRTLANKKDIWNLSYSKIGRSIFYTKKSIDKYLNQSF